MSQLKKNEQRVVTYSLTFQQLDEALRLYLVGNFGENLDGLQAVAPQNVNEFVVTFAAAPADPV
jgi:hypothetical protein